MLPWRLFFLKHNDQRRQCDKSNNNSIMKAHILFNHKKCKPQPWTRKLISMVFYGFTGHMLIHSQHKETIIGNGKKHSDTLINCIMHQFHHKVADCFQVALFSSTVWSNVTQLLKMVRTRYLKVPHTTSITDGSTPLVG